MIIDSYKKYCLTLALLFLNLKINGQISYGFPSEVGMDSLLIHTKVDSILNDAIKQKAFPGVQVLAVKNHKIIFHKAYGYQTYDSIKTVKLTDMYDIASVTKIIGPLPALMKLHSHKKLNLDAPFSKYWKPWRCKKDKKNITVREVLAHQAGLIPYIPFVKDVMNNDLSVNSKQIKQKCSKRFSTPVYKDMFVKNKFKKHIYKKVNTSKVSETKKYKYSGLSFLLYPEIVKQLTSVDYTTYLKKHFYFPLKAYSLVYTPKLTRLQNTIIPTEIDTAFRKDLVHNWVHDENAALLGGVSGNAGLFANAIDLAKIMQMYCNYGIYNGKRYIAESTLKEFTQVQYPKNKNRRGLGFDKPLLGNDTLSIKKCYPASEVSSDSFGHSGFTGTFVWADPKYDFVFVFLSNRVYPSRKHRNIYNLNIRPKVQQVFYKAMKKIPFTSKKVLDFYKKEFFRYSFLSL